MAKYKNVEIPGDLYYFNTNKIKSKLRGLFYNYFVIKEIGLAAGQNDIS